MKILTFIFIILTLALPLWISKLNLDMRLLQEEVNAAKDEISRIKQEGNSLLKYKNKTALSLDKFYLEVFNEIKELSSYYSAVSEVKIIDSKDLVNTREFFKESPHRGIKYVDLLCRIDLKDQPDTDYLLERLYKMLSSKPIEILEVRIEKNILNLTMRLFGP